MEGKGGRLILSARVFTFWELTYVPSFVAEQFFQTHHENLVLTHVVFYPKKIFLKKALEYTELQTFNKIKDIEIGGKSLL